MPRFNDVARILVDSGANAVAEMPIDAAVGSEIGLYFDTNFVSGGDHRAAMRARDLWQDFGTRINRNINQSNAIVSLPYFFHDGVSVDAQQELLALAAAATAYKLTIRGARDDGSDLVLTVTGGRIATWGDGTKRTGLRLTQYADNHGDDEGNEPLQGLRVDLRLADGTAILPQRPVLTPQDIWVRRGAVLGDFSGLVLTGDEDTVDTEAVKTVQLETSYLPILEDLDTLVQYGRDDDGVPVTWSIASTERGEQSIFLNLRARLT